MQNYLLFDTQTRKKDTNVYFSPQIPIFRKCLRPAATLLYPEKEQPDQLAFGQAAVNHVSKTINGNGSGHQWRWDPTIRSR